MVVRLSAAALGVLNLWWGAWARLSPRGFFDDFPGFGQHWTAAYPPYNVHLVTDLGATLLTLGFLLMIGAVSADRRVRAVVLGGVLVFNTIHLSFHATDHGTLGSPGFWASTTTLIAGVLVPLILLVIDRATDRPVAASIEPPPVRR